MLDRSSDEVCGVESIGGGAVVGWLEAVDALGLDSNANLRVCRGGIHAQYELAGDLGGNHVVGDSVFDLGIVQVIWEEVEHLSIHAIEIDTMLRLSLRPCPVI